MKSLSTVRDTWIGTQSYMEKRTGRREVEVTRKRREGIKRGESKLASTLPYVLSTVWNTQRGSQIYIEKRRARKEIEVTRRRRGGIKGGKSNLASKQFPMCSP